MVNIDIFGEFHADPRHVESEIDKLSGNERNSAILIEGHIFGVTKDLQNGIYETSDIPNGVFRGGKNLELFPAHKNLRMISDAVSKGASYLDLQTNLTQEERQITASGRENGLYSLRDCEKANAILNYALNNPDCANIKVFIGNEHQGVPYALGMLQKKYNIKVNYYPCPSDYGNGYNKYLKDCIEYYNKFNKSKINLSDEEIENFSKSAKLSSSGIPYICNRDIDPSFEKRIKDHPYINQDVISHVKTFYQSRVEDRARLLEEALTPRCRTPNCYTNDHLSRNHFLRRSGLIR